MEIFDSTVIAPAAPHIAADFGIPAVGVNVAITAYVLTLAVLIPTSGWLADRFGTRRVFMTAIALFTLASASCAVAVNLPMLTGARVLQGIGGAMMVPVGRLVVLRSTAKPELVKAIAYLTWPALVAPVFAPTVGGLLSTYATWRWIFLINVPLGIVGLLVAVRVVPDARAAEPARLDRWGVTLSAVGIAALVVGMEGLGAPSPEWPLVVTALAAALTALTGAVLYLLRARSPLLDLRILRIQTYRAAAIGGSVFRAVISSAIPFLLALFFQIGFGWTAARAGLVVMALFLGNVLIKPATTPLMRRFGIRTTMIVAVLASAACLVGIAFLQPRTPLPVLLAVLLANGIFRSVGLTTYNTLAFADVDAERMSHANPLFATLQELGAGLGVAVAALLVRLGGQVAAPLGMGAADGPFRVAFILLVVVLAVPLIEALLLARAAGAAVTGRT